MVLLIDNYDSFSYNLVQLIGELSKGQITVARNDEITIDQIREMNPDAIILSPGPGKPENAGICPQVVEQLKGQYPILGVCLGHQCICQVFGAQVTYAKKLMHGKQSRIEIKNDDSIFAGVNKTFKGARYHSLSAKAETIPEQLIVLAIDEKDQEIMAVKHRDYKIYGLQFHPESVLTPEGKIIVKNFLENK